MLAKRSSTIGGSSRMRRDPFAAIDEFLLAANITRLPHVRGA